MNRKIAENIANIGIVAGNLLSNQSIEVIDSKDLTNTIIDLGYVFEDEYGEMAEKKENYIDLIDSFAENRLLKQFGIKKENY